MPSWLRRVLSSGGMRAWIATCFELYWSNVALLWCESRVTLIFLLPGIGDYLSSVRLGCESRVTLNSFNSDYQIQGPRSFCITSNFIELVVTTRRIGNFRYQIQAQNEFSGESAINSKWVEGVTKLFYISPGPSRFFSLVAVRMTRRNLPITGGRRDFLIIDRGESFTKVPVTHYRILILVSEFENNGSRINPSYTDPLTQRAVYDIYLDRVPHANTILSHSFYPFSPNHFLTNNDRGETFCRCRQSQELIWKKKADQDPRLGYQYRRERPQRYNRS